MLADLIIGNMVDVRPGYNFVRVPDQNRVYAARADIDISTRFNDWIETNLLEVERDDVKHAVLNDYQIDERTGAVRRRGEFIVDWVEEDVWTANDVPAGMEVDYVQMNLLVGGIIGLEIVGVRPKPEGLSGNLRQAFQERTITNADIQTMQSRGFYPTQSGDMLSNEGELLVRTEEGVRYTLRFGEILYGSGNAVAIGDETSDDQDAGVGENRYVLITAEFDESGLPEPPRSSNRDFENKAEGQWTDADRENKERGRPPRPVGATHRDRPQPCRGALHPVCELVLRRLRRKLRPRPQDPRRFPEGDRGRKHRARRTAGVVARPHAWLKHCSRRSGTFTPSAGCRPARHNSSSGCI